MSSVLETFWGANSTWNLSFEAEVKGYEQMGEVLLLMTNGQRISEAGVANRATGGIASLKK